MLSVTQVTVVITARLPKTVQHLLIHQKTVQTASSTVLMVVTLEAKLGLARAQIVTRASVVQAVKY